MKWTIKYCVITSVLIIGSFFFILFPAVTATDTSPVITSQPANQSVNLGQTAAFRVVASGYEPLSYQWQKDGEDIQGATGNSYTTPATTVYDNDSSFTVTVTHSINSVTSDAALLTVNIAPVITTQPVNETVNAGQAATFSVVASGAAPMRYQWQKNGADIAGAMKASYTTPATVVYDNDSIYTVVVTNSISSVTSNPSELTVNDRPTITTQH